VPLNPAYEYSMEEEEIDASILPSNALTCNCFPSAYPLFTETVAPVPSRDPGWEKSQPGEDRITA
jgi:hypothetical protein